MHRLKQGKIEMELLLFLIVIVITSAVVLFLVQSGIVAVKADHNDVSVLNAEFIPFAREGTLTIKEFQFCNQVDENYNCVEEKNDFKLDEEVHFRFIVESSAVDGKVKLVENYRLKGPQGDVVLEVDETKNYNFEIKNGIEKEKVYYKDFIITDQEAEVGEHSLDLIIENPLLDKKVTFTKKFQLQP